MNFNSIVFPAPTDDKYPNIEKYKNQILYIPKTLPDNTKFHIPCLFQESTFNPNTNKIFVYFHGNAEDMFNAIGNLNIIQNSLPFHTLSVEYPGYSIYYKEKDAETIENDSLIIFDYLVNEWKVKPKNIILCGRSIGTGPATFLASQRNPGALIMISPIQSIQDAANSLIGFMKFIVKDRFNNYERIKDVTCPLLLIHGQKDSLISFEKSIQLTERTGGPYELILPENMNHNDVHIYNDFLEPISRFLKNHNLVNVDKGEIFIDKKLFEIPEYLLSGEWNNMDKTSEFVRKLLKI